MVFVLVAASALLLVLPGGAAWAEKPWASGTGGGSRPVVASGPYTWRNAASNAYLDQDYTDGTPHTAVLAWPYNGGTNQRWYWDQLADGSTRQINAASGACLDQDYTDGTPHTAVLAWSCNGGRNQRWF